MKFPTNRLLLIPAYAIACGLVGCDAGIANTAEVNDEIASAMPVNVVIPRSTDLFARYHTTSTISSDADAPIPARVPGEVVEIMVEEGDLVEKGQVLARLDGDRLRLQTNQARANFEQMTREHHRLIDLHARGLVSGAEFDRMTFDLDALDAGYELTKLNYEYTFIRASIAGIVSAREIKIGQNVNEGDTAFRVTDAAELLAYLRIPQNELARISAGHAASLQVDAMPEIRFDAVIARISPTIDARSGTFRATAVIDNSDNMLAPGMFGKFEIAYEKHADALVIPAAAVLQEDNIAVVYVIENGMAARRIITTGIEENGEVEVLSGLEGREQIIVTGQNGLRDGSKVLASATNPAPAIG